MSRCLSLLVIVSLWISACASEPVTPPDELINAQNNEADRAQLLGGLSKADGGTMGDYNYCDAPVEACGAGEGDCDYDSQCAGDLRCGVDNGFRFGLDPDFDVCVSAHCVDGLLSGDESAIDCGGSCGDCTCNLGNGHIHTCGNGCACGTGEGDCDDDSQCDQTGGAAQCVTNVGARFGMDPSFDVCLPVHCTDGILSGDELLGFVDCSGSCGPCLCSLPNGHIHRCTPDCPCPAGFGDCDSDNDCVLGHRCEHNVGLTYGMPAAYDVCVLDI